MGRRRRTSGWCGSAIRRRGRANACTAHASESACHAAASETAAVFLMASRAPTATGGRPLPRLRRCGGVPWRTARAAGRRPVPRRCQRREWGRGWAGRRRRGEVRQVRPGSGRGGAAAERGPGGRCVRFPHQGLLSRQGGSPATSLQKPLLLVAHPSPSSLSIPQRSLSGPVTRSRRGARRTPRRRRARQRLQLQNAPCPKARRRLSSVSLFCLLPRVLRCGFSQRSHRPAAASP